MKRLITTLLLTGALAFSYGQSELKLSEKKYTRHLIEGRVSLEKDTVDLQHTTIRIKETGQVFQTDSTGAFRIGLPKDFRSKKITLTFSHRSYKLSELMIRRKQLPVTNLIVHLHAEELRDEKPELPLLKY